MVVNSMSYAKYERYKDSGVDWLGKIPSDWELGRISAFFSERRQKVSDKDYPALSVTKLGVFPQWENVAKSNDGDNRKLVKKGDFVINSRSDRKGSSGIAKQDGSVSLINIVLKPVNIEPRYSEYLFKSYNFIEEFYRVGHGIVADLWTTRFDDIKNSMIALPTFDEQVKIANFLDQKTAQIDQAIALKQQQIEKLGEYKQIVIQNAVTKGLNSNAPMKDSGVEWIGDIPEHWEVKKLKYLTSKVGSGITPSGGATTYVDKGIPLLRSQNIHFDGLVLDNVANISLNVHKSMKNSQVKQHDVLLNITGGSLGRCCYNSSNDEMNVNQHVCIVRPNNLIKGEFLNGLMSSEVGQKQIWFFQQGGGREGLNFQNLKNFDFPLPSIDEQKEIIAHIEILKQHFKKSVDNYQTQIDRLKEYKNILINQAVTGKIKI
jgi:type I restriction enzyme S subunit